MYWRYGIPRALQSLRTNWRASLYSMLIIAASFAMLGLGVLLYLNVVHVSRIWLANTTISLFLEQGIAAERREALLEQVRTDPMVERAVVVSPDEGLRDLARKLGAGSSLMNGVRTDSLPYTIDFELRGEAREQIRDIAARYGALDGVGDVVYAERALDRVRLFLLVTEAVGLFFVGLIVLSFLFIVSNSTKLSLHTRQEEIEILAAVGATRRTIGSSFVVEGVVLAGAGFALALGIVWGSYRLLVAALEWSHTTHGLAERTIFFPPDYLGIALGVALVLGGLGSRISVGRLLAEVA